MAATTDTRDSAAAPGVRPVMRRRPHLFGIGFSILRGTARAPANRG